MNLLPVESIYVGIIGTRSRDTDQDKEKARRKLLKIAERFGWHRIHLVSGGCRVGRDRVPCGGDRFAEEFAEEYGLPITIFWPRKWKLDPKLLKQNPRAAHAIINYERNGDIAELSTYLIAVVSSDRTGGTENTIKTYGKLGKTKLRLC